MSMLHTIRAGYQAMRRADVTVDDTVLDGSTSGYTYKWSDRPADAVYLGPEFNGAEIIFAGNDTSDGQNFTCDLFGYPSGGGAEFIGEISGTIGTARFADTTSALYADTLTIVSDEHLATLAVHDEAGSNRIAKLELDTCGYEYLYAQFPDISAGINAYIRPY